MAIDLDEVLDQAAAHLSRVDGKRFQAQLDLRAAIKLSCVPLDPRNPVVTFSDRHRVVVKVLTMKGWPIDDVEGAARIVLAPFESIEVSRERETRPASVDLTRARAEAFALTQREGISLEQAHERLVSEAPVAHSHEPAVRLSAADVEKGISEIFATQRARAMALSSRTGLDLGEAQAAIVERDEKTIEGLRKMSAQPGTPIAASASSRTVRLSDEPPETSRIVREWELATKVNSRLCDNVDRAKRKGWSLKRLLRWAARKDVSAGRSEDGTMQKLRALTLIWNGNRSPFRPAAQA